MLDTAYGVSIRPATASDLHSPYPSAGSACTSTMTSDIIMYIPQPATTVATRVLTTAGPVTSRRSSSGCAARSSHHRHPPSATTESATRPRTAGD